MVGLLKRREAWVVEVGGHGDPLFTPCHLDAPGT
jgi:hypothetical protein